ncbi:MAG TPA: metal-dependent hydrolase [Symbiobacteriaceae bacterium]|jgi:L-ascorbate metabolism protein UlaG (beta-lactamase superfamily)|nr:metal-dependent hydrolase [Symbiobacteriaceae bacterium]
MMRLRWFGHSAFELTDGKTTLLFDPFLTGNPKAPVTAEELHPQYILLTHFHGDHVGDTVAIAKRTGATVITTYEGGEDLAAQGLKVHTMALGGKFAFDFGLVRVTMAFHGSGFPGGHAAGFVVHMGSKRIYHAGDTCLFSDMKLLNGVIEQPGIDVALLPVGDNYTMGPEEAAIATEWIGPRVVIPMHWGTFPAIMPGDPAVFAQRVEAAGKTRVVTLQPGDHYEF